MHHTRVNKSCLQTHSAWSLVLVKTLDPVVNKLIMNVFAGPCVSDQVHDCLHLVSPKPHRHHFHVLFYPGRVCNVSRKSRRSGLVLSQVSRTWDRGNRRDVQVNQVKPCRWPGLSSQISCTSQGLWAQRELHGPRSIQPICVITSNESETAYLSQSSSYYVQFLEGNFTTSIWSGMNLVMKMTKKAEPCKMMQNFH